MIRLLGLVYYKITNKYSCKDACPILLSGDFFYWLSGVDYYN